MSSLLSKASGTTKDLILVMTTVNNTLCYEVAMVPLLIASGSVRTSLSSTCNRLWSPSFRVSSPMKSAVGMCTLTKIGSNAAFAQLTAHEIYRGRCCPDLVPIACVAELTRRSGIDGDPTPLLATGIRPWDLHCG